MSKKLYFYYSAMNAGKSTMLLQSSYNYKERGMETLIFSPKFDTRFGDTVVYSRIGLKEKAIGYDKEFHFYEFIEAKQQSFENLACLLIDEAHFLKKEQVYQLLQITIDFELPILAYGLRTDFLGKPFEGAAHLLALAQEVVEIKTICFCGKKATMNMRIDQKGEPVTYGEQIQVGGNESYTSVCYKHFYEKVIHQKVVT